MATLEEQQETMEALKGPRYYRIQVTGYGGEASYMSISKEAHDFWAPIVEEHGDSPLIHYIVNAESCTAAEVNSDTEYSEYDIEIESIPDEAKFMHDLNDVESVGYTWYEPAEEIDHTWGATYGSAYLTVEEVDSDDYSASHIADVIEQEEISELNDRVLEESDNTVEIVEMGCCDDNPKGVEYIAQMYSSEKGGFFDGVIETVGNFDPKKLKIHTIEYLNGEDTVTEVHYDGVEVDNNGGDTNGKGYYAAVWKN